MRNPQAMLESLCRDAVYLMQRYGKSDEKQNNSFDN